VPTAVDSLKPRESTAPNPTLWPRIFERWHLLSLDAPTVAALWSWFFARAMRLELPWHAPLLLALGTWLVYVADRILDGTRTSPASPLRERHRFHARNRKAFLSASVVVGCTLLWLIVARMSANARCEDTILFAAALLYLVLVHKSHPGRTGAPGDRSSSLGWKTGAPGDRSSSLGWETTWLPKELAVGIVFAAATAVPAWSRLHSGRTALFPAIALFAVLCWLNCVAIERWENPPPDGDLQSSHAHGTTRWATKHFRATTLFLALISAAFASASIISNPGTPAVYLAVMTAALCLAAIDLFRERLSEIHLRVAADAALLTPLIFIPLLS